MPRDTTQNIPRNFFIFFELFTNISYTIQHTTEKWYIFFFQFAYKGKGRIYIYIYIFYKAKLIDTTKLTV